MRRPFFPIQPSPAEVAAILWLNREYSFDTNVPCFRSESGGMAKRTVPPGLQIAHRALLELHEEAQRVLVQLPVHADGHGLVQVGELSTHVAPEPGNAHDCGAVAEQLCLEFDLHFIFTRKPLHPGPLPLGRGSRRGR